MAITNGHANGNGTSAPRKLRIAVLGCGRMGARHAENVCPSLLWHLLAPVPRYRHEFVMFANMADIPTDPSSDTRSYRRSRSGRTQMGQGEPRGCRVSIIHPTSLATSLCILLLHPASFYRPLIIPQISFLGIHTHVTVRSEYTVLIRLSVHSDPEEIFARDDIDAVIIATITPTHARLATKAIEKGLHVLLEKPIAIEVKDSIPVVEAAEGRPDLKVMIGFVRRCEFPTLFTSSQPHIPLSRRRPSTHSGL